ncbi:uncharacterized protein [Physcomitrium patens]|uniref:BHLH domain-containing protein n=1 Tax=Physcomitrium patens TaxID=3218 RepID=A0A2K1IY32_PHYPA|nr:transcription factor bHLH128-like [Physcomitrium patens]XP_024356479.1 transcription factor bHLH128-like [Physcomitrium patens]XP_024356480.1 transcription factor bHLH128-like [Physcomitrium patens]XP_024356481.1 transcription factor bHLH128-like [Physcomitrium patens]XP_024356482.1 transcription factor bHLH128-like [Physcomitrium patens]PNR34184.1 hypothetical protein PHYPA_024001 [Physcomitrium patens]|eukprot:XP_024356478.1 transcription factor bHLH128-like [Physcomitrella patens]
MGSVNEEISAIFQSSHASLSQGSLAGVMAPVTSPDMFASFSSHAAPPSSFQQGGGLVRTSSMSQTALGNTLHNNRQHPSRGNPSSQRWPSMAGDEKWMLDAKGEVLEMHASNSSFGAGFESFMPMISSAPPNGGLQRYHSAPSTFLQALSEDAFTQLPPIGNSNMSGMFSEGGLAPITEQMDVERPSSGNSMNDFEQFLSPDSDFSRRAAMSALGKPENETYSSIFPVSKSAGLVRQKSLPVPALAQQNVPRQDAIEEHNSEESLSGTSEDNSLVNGLKAYLQDDGFARDALTWPASPGTSGGKRPRRFPGESETSSGSAENSKSFRLNSQSNGLIRHMSLPTPTDGPANQNSDDQYVQMRARAKRGCATHPRSIAERVRRTRISERMKKLQDLVPNMEKTTNTSDMLDETVEYVKSLQMKVKELTETIAQLKAATQMSP